MLKYCLLVVLLHRIRSDFVLNILHTNDVHSRIEEVNKYGGFCSTSDSAALKCFGGVARRHTVS